MKINSLSFFLYILLLFPSCSFYTYYHPEGSKGHPAVSPINVRLYSGDIQQEYEVIAAVTADVFGTGDKAGEYLKKNAAKLGADAVIFVQLNKINTIADRTGISGVAVRLK